MILYWAVNHKYLEWAAVVHMKVQSSLMWWLLVNDLFKERHDEEYNVQDYEDKLVIVIMITSYQIACKCFSSLLPATGAWSLGE